MLPWLTVLLVVVGSRIVAGQGLQRGVTFGMALKVGHPLRPTCAPTCPRARQDARLIRPLRVGLGPLSSPTSFPTPSWAT